MKKLFVSLLVAALLVAPSVQAKDSGGLASGLVGCCFGVRTGIDYNSGKKLGIRDVLDLFWFGRIWSAVTCYQGTTREELHSEEPLYF